MHEHAYKRKKTQPHRRLGRSYSTSSLFSLSYFFLPYIFLFHFLLLCTISNSLSLAFYVYFSSLSPYLLSSLSHLGIFYLIFPSLHLFGFQHKAIARLNYFTNDAISQIWRLKNEAFSRLTSWVRIGVSTKMQMSFCFKTVDWEAAATNNPS